MAQDFVGVVARKRSRIVRSDRQELLAALVPRESRARQHGLELFVLARHRVGVAAADPDGHRRDADVLLRAFDRARIRQHQGFAVRRQLRPHAEKSASMGGGGNGRRRVHPHGASVLHRRVPRRSRDQLGSRRRTFPADVVPVVHRLPAAVGPARVLGDHRRNQYREAGAIRRADDPIPAARRP